MFTRLYKLEEEINLWGVRHDSEETISVCNKQGEVKINNITIKELFEGRHKTLLHSLVYDVFKAENEQMVFVLTR